MAGDSQSWATATDSELRRAAAGVCGFIERDGESDCYFEHDNALGPFVEDWTPDSNRDQLARVFMAAAGMAGVCTTRSDESPWTVALRDPRAALIGLLDLLNWPMPEETKQ